MTGRDEPTPEPRSDRWVAETLKPLIVERRKQRIEDVLDNRTYGITVVLEELYDHGNVSAVLRSCDALGIQRINLVLTGESFKTDRKISQGAHKWLDVYHYHDSWECARSLKDEGYRLVATHLESARPLDEIDFTQKTALVFGNERDGVSDRLLEVADARVKIPMYGFVQSFNISVAAAISLHHAVNERIRAFGRLGDLTEAERDHLRARFYRRSVRRSDLILDRAAP